MKMAEVLRDIHMLIDEALKVVDETIAKSTGEKKETYLEYRKDFREMGVLLYRIIGKMRMDKRFDPEEEKALMTMTYHISEEEVK